MFINPVVFACLVAARIDTSAVSAACDRLSEKESILKLKTVRKISEETAKKAGKSVRRWTGKSELNHDGLSDSELLIDRFWCWHDAIVNAVEIGGRFDVSLPGRLAHLATFYPNEELAKEQEALKAAAKAKLETAKS